MIYDYKNIPWHLFVRQEDIDRLARIDEQKKKEKALVALNKKQTNQTNQQNQLVSVDELNKSNQAQVDFFSLEPTEINLDN